MNNVVRLKAWDTRSKAWIYGWGRGHGITSKVTPSWDIYVTVTGGNRAEIFEASCLDERVIIVRSTGLTDEDGVEIWEGDIIDSSYDGCNVLVVWNKDLGMFSIQYDKRLRTSVGILVTQICRVVGNIFQNPELLKPETEQNGGDDE